MERKQIYLDAGQEEALKQLAERERTSVSALIRSAVDEYLEEHLTPEVAPEDHPIWSIIGIAGGPDMPTDGAENHDRALYDRKA
jgi:hypothetical protein